MKTLTSYFKPAVLLVVVGISFVACSNKKESNGTTANTGVIGTGIPGCPTCTGGAGVLFSAPAYYSGMAMTLQVMGDTNQITQLQYMGSAPAKVYTGQATMQGALTVSQGMYAGNCVLVGGTYQMTAASVGAYQAGMFSFQQIQMTNGQYQYIAQLQGVIVDANADGIPEGFGAQLYIVQGPSMYGSYTSCGDPVGFTLAP